MRLGALEAGGTKMVLAVYWEDGTEIERITIPTESPEETMPPMIDFFRRHQVDALGVGSFGPLELHPEAPNYGSITSTPKLKWKDYPLLKNLLGGRDIPAKIDTDVNAAALAEATMGAARGCGNTVYVTIGTGVGGGVILDGKVFHGFNFAGADIDYCAEENILGVKGFVAAEYYSAIGGGAACKDREACCCYADKRKNFYDVHCLYLSLSLGREFQFLSKSFAR